MPPPVILCVDDNEEGLTLRKMVLESAGYSVIVAIDGEKALTLFGEEPVDGVVLDYCMPGMNGGEVAAAMRRLKPAVPILLLSGYMNEIPPEALSAVDMFIAKGSPATSLIGELRNRVPLPATRKGPEREDLLEKAERIIAASRDTVRRSREHSRATRRYLDTSKNRAKE